MNQDGTSTKPEDVKHKFVNLVETHFICRCPEVENSDQSAEPADQPTFRPMTDPYILPDAVDIYGMFHLTFFVSAISKKISKFI